MMLRSIPCLQCNRPLDHPDPIHRYCPYCGTVRLLPDPPAAGPAGSFLVIGRDSIGPDSGLLYAYRDRRSVPEAVSALQGAFSNDPQWSGDLNSSSGMPLPERALNTWNGPTLVATPDVAREAQLGTRIWHTTARHGRLFALSQGGQLAALMLPSLGYVRNWLFPSWTAATSATRLQVSETLLYAALSSPGGTQFVAVDVGHGRDLIDHPLPYVEAQVLVAGGAAAVIAPVAQQRQPVEAYRLDDFVSRSSAPPHKRADLRVQGDAHGNGSVIRLGSDFVVAAADGKLHRWSTQDASEPQILWPNPMNARVAAHCVPLGSDSVAFVADGRDRGAGISLICLRTGAAGTVEMGAVLELPLLRSSRSTSTTAISGTLFMAVQNPGDAISVFAQSIEAGDAARPVCRLSGTQDASVRFCQVIPWEGEPHLLLHCEAGLQRDLWLIHPRTGATRPIGGHPHRDHLLQVVWDAGRVWIVHLDDGRVTPVVS